MKEIIQLKYSGQMDESIDYMNLGLQTVLVLIGGFVLWRFISGYQQKLQNNRRKNTFFDSKYSKHWRK